MDSGFRRNDGESAWSREIIASLHFQRNKCPLQNPSTQPCHREERSDVAISGLARLGAQSEIASLRSQ
jgi:hypothetical protein